MNRLQSGMFLPEEKWVSKYQSKSIIELYNEAGVNVCDIPTDIDYAHVMLDLYKLATTGSVADKNFAADFLNGLGSEPVGFRNLVAKKLLLMYGGYPCLTGFLRERLIYLSDPSVNFSRLLPPRMKKDLCSYEGTTEFVSKKFWTLYHREHISWFRYVLPKILIVSTKFNLEKEYEQSVQNKSTRRFILRYMRNLVHFGNLTLTTEQPSIKAKL